MTCLFLRARLYTPGELETASCRKEGGLWRGRWGYNRTTYPRKELRILIPSTHFGRLTATDNATWVDHQTSSDKVQEATTPSKDPRNTPTFRPTTFWGNKGKRLAMGHGPWAMSNWKRSMRQCRRARQSGRAKVRAASGLVAERVMEGRQKKVGLALMNVSRSSMCSTCDPRRRCRLNNNHTRTRNEDIVLSLLPETHHGDHISAMGHRPGLYSYQTKEQRHSRPSRLHSSHDRVIKGNLSRHHLHLHICTQICFFPIQSFPKSISVPLYIL